MKRSGNIRRQLKKRSMEIVNIEDSIQIQNQSVLTINREVTDENSVLSNNICDENVSESYHPQDLTEQIEGTSKVDEWMIGSDSEDEDVSQLTTFEMENNFRTKLSEWALATQPTQHQLRELLKVCNDTLPFKLPQDPRTILGTPRCINLFTFEDCSQYWHHGLIDPLKSALKNMKSLPDRLSLNINVDGLTIYESSKEEFWPILCNIYELKSINPIVIGIYRGIGM